MMRFGWFIALVVLVGAIFGLYFMRGPLALWITQRALDRNMALDRIADVPDGLSVLLCGSGSPLPDGDRAGPCTAIIAGRKLYIFDAGDGAARNLTRMGFMPARASAMFLTHFHSDHIDGLGNVLLQRWAGGHAEAPLPVYGPTGVTSVVDGFNAAYALDRGYRIAHHGPDIVPPDGAGGRAVDFGTPGPLPVKVLEDDGLIVEAFAVDHQPIEPAVGYRLSYKGRIVVISGDTAASPAVEGAAKGCDVLVHEALAPNLVALMRHAAERAGLPKRAKILGDIPGYHTSPEQAAEIAQRAGVKYLLLTHIVPPLPVPGLDVPFLGRAAAIFGGPIRIGHDGDMVVLPAGSAEVIAKRVGF